ncbi:histidine kinase [Frigidibacter albus]|uniref:histidine kinase n=1 Tax=Frigidibacter albus TaxID=1465486 RepID=A0A6L8VH93_9RHOB|nr:CHASE3 domain-containing protein [Frigidibacter albus]MZQ89101.1 histidine kinase [Frigidibacter albus]NBE30842.1 histidine kinase [Frigidibacter albus]GGH51437.1 sensor histidine kinase [Frigidibacter albus]
MQTINRNIKQTAILLLLGATLLAILAGSSTFISFRSDAAFERTIAERQLRRSASDLLAALQDAETGQRGYLITLDPAFLEPYQGARTRILELRSALEQWLQDDAGRGADVLAELDALIELRLGLIESTLEAAGAGDVAAARAIVAQGQGKPAMDRIRDLLGEIIAASDVRTSTLVQVQGRMNLWLKTASILGGVAMLAVVGSAFVLLARQLRALRAAEDQLRRLNSGLEGRVRQRTEDLMRANQEVQRFAYIVTHDLRAPLVNIMGFTSELETALKPLQAYVLADGETVTEDNIRDARLAAAEDLPEALAFIRSSTRKMDGLINAILKISRDGRRELKPETVDLKALAEQAAASVAHQLGETGGEVEIDIRVRPLVTDRLSVEQALGNLVDNAVKYASPDRPLQLRIRAVPDGPRMVRVEVEDNGRGISEADHERVFELFRRSGTQDRPGEGIGLAHVRTVVRNLGGEITLRSVHGQGSTFTLHLPVDLRAVLETVRT